jgi:putative heme iron utilization protein
MSRAREARELIRTHRSGVLSTHCLKFPGFPYGSALPHVADALGRPVLLISHLAEHTHNIEADPRVSFIVCSAGPDLQARPRVTVLGEARITEDEAVAARYLRFYPDHRQYLEIGGFRFYAVEPTQVRYIQGFGGLHWIAGASYTDAAAGVAAAEADILAHMNQDHRDAMRDYCRLVHAVDCAQPEMVGIDCDGFDLRADGCLLRFMFDAPIANAGDVRQALVALAQRARA